MVRMARPATDPDLSTYRGRFAANLRTLRQKRFDTQAEFVEALEVQGLVVVLMTVSSWERGARVPPVDSMPQIAKALGVPIRHLLPTE